MTNREHILKVIAGLDDNTLCDVWTELPDEIRNLEPIHEVCESCIANVDEDCYCDQFRCRSFTSAWINAEVRTRR